MIKPIVYHSFEEKEALELRLMSEIPYKVRLAKSKALMELFASQVKKSHFSTRENKIHDK